MTYQIVVQARDGKWHFGPDSMEQELRASERGAYGSAADASQAIGRISANGDQRTSLGRIIIKKRS